jgi:NAD(P)-dependent dehydrogenase (short-subunit alcohol dehydrogenase family)
VTTGTERDRSRLAVVTGGGRGIGRAITHRLANSGWHCLIVGLDQQDLDESASQANASVEKVAALVADIAGDEGRESLIAAAEKLDSPLGLLVNCAAQCTPMPLFGQSSEMWKDDLSTNLVAASVLSAWAIEKMATLGAGAIINIGSVYGSLGLNNYFYEGVYPDEGPHGPLRAPAYHATKGGLAALTRELAVVAGKWNIRVNTIAPGMIKTPERHIPAEREALYCESTPIRRLGRPEDIAAVVDFLASDDASFVTGAEWTVDGGWSVW